MTAKAMRQRRKDQEPEQEQTQAQTQAQAREQETPQDEAGEAGHGQDGQDVQDVQVDADEATQDSVVAAAAGAVAGFAALGAMWGEIDAGPAVLPPPPPRTRPQVFPKPVLAREVAPSEPRSEPLPKRAPEPEIDAGPGASRPGHKSESESQSESQSQSQSETIPPDDDADRPDQGLPDLVEVDTDETGSDEGHDSDERHERHERDDSPVPVPAEVEGLLRLRLKNDTGWTDEQRSDLVTSDATVQVEGVDRRHGLAEYRINVGPWRPLEPGNVIADAHFPEEGRNQVDVRSLGPDGHPLSEATMQFEVDRTRPGARLPEVVHVLDKVNESGTPDPNGLYALTHRPLVRVTGMQEGDRWIANQYGPTTSTSIGKTVAGSSDELPEALFKEGAQIVGVTSWDRAGNDDKVIRLEQVWLDTTPPPAPQWSSIGELLGVVDQFQLDNLEPHAHLEHRPDEQSAWTRVQAGSTLTGRQEIRQVDLAGNISLETAWLLPHQILTV